MNKVLFLFFLISFQSNAQLTKGEVFNYEIGDVHQTEIYGNQPSIQRVLDTIVNKVVGVDTITYTINRITFTNGPGPNFPIVDYSVETLIVTQLDSFPTHYNYTSCLPPTDTSYIGFCGETVNLRNSNGAPFPICFEPPFWESAFQEGLGGPYYQIQDISNLLEETYRLIYSNSAQWGECGTYYDLSIGIEENKPNIPKIYPNPASSTITIEVELISPKEVLVRSATGQLLFEGIIDENSNSIDLTSLNSGYYFIQLDQHMYPIIIK